MPGPTCAQDAGKFCYGLPGSIAPFENFDPAGFLKDASKEQVYTWREAELTHGRVGMLAALGISNAEFHLGSIPRRSTA